MTVDNPLGLLCPLLLSLAFVWAGANITARKGFDFGPWMLPCFMGIGIIGFVTIVAMYALPGAGARSITPEVAKLRISRARRVGTALTFISVFLLVAVAAMMIANQ